MYAPSGGTTTIYSYVSSSSGAGTTTTTLAKGTGSQTGTVEVIQPSAGYVTITSYSSMDPSATPSTTTTLVTAMGSTTGTVEILYPSSTGYTTVTKVWASSTTSTTTVLQPSATTQGEVDIFVPACGSIKPNTNFKLTLFNSNNDTGNQVGLSKASTTAIGDLTRVAGGGTNSNATFYLDANCALWTTTGVTTATEQAYINTSSGGDPQFYFAKTVPTTNAAIPTCFVDNNGVFTCTRPPPAGSVSSFTLFYACPNYWRLGFTVPAPTASMTCFQINMQAVLA